MAVFKALWVTEAPHGVYETQVVERDTGDLPAGDVLIRVQYSSLNYPTCTATWRGPWAGAWSASTRC